MTGLCQVEEVKPSSVNGIGWKIAPCGLYAATLAADGTWRCERHADVVDPRYSGVWRERWEAIKHEALE